MKSQKLKLLKDKTHVTFIMWDGKLLQYDLYDSFFFDKYIIVECLTSTNGIIIVPNEITTPDLDTYGNNLNLSGLIPKHFVFSTKETLTEDVSKLVASLTKDVDVAKLKSFNLAFFKRLKVGLELAMLDISEELENIVTEINLKECMESYNSLKLAHAQITTNIDNHRKEIAMIAKNSPTLATKYADKLQSLNLEVGIKGKMDILNSLDELDERLFRAVVWEVCAGDFNELSQCEESIMILFEDLHESAGLSSDETESDVMQSLEKLSNLGLITLSTKTSEYDNHWIILNLDTEGHSLWNDLDELG